MQKNETGGIKITDAGGGTLLLVHEYAENCDALTSAKAWATIKANLKMRYSGQVFQLVPQVFVPQINPGKLASPQIIKSMIAFRD